MPTNKKTDKQSFASNCARFVYIIGAVILIVILYLSWRFGIDRAVDYEDIEKHFMYGSTGGEREAGFPYWVFAVLPEICPEELPGKGYASLGLLFEKGKTLPIGMSMRRNMGMDRVFLNCAACHTGTVRETADAKPRIVLGMPANNFDVMAFQNFFFNCAKNAKFTADQIIPLIEDKIDELDLLDKYLVYPVAINLMRDGLIRLSDRFHFAETQPNWGPGRVDTFNAAKASLNFPLEHADPAELVGTADLPSIWNQAKRQGMQLHWDGNNTSVEERNKSAAFGTGTTPPTIDLTNIKRIEDWLLNATPPNYPYPIKQALVEKGKPIYKKYCADCHGVSGNDFQGEKVGTVTPIKAIATDRWRLDSYTYTLAVNQNTLYAGYPWRFKHFRKTFGYTNMPLDGIWLRGPYLHNGSVPSIRDLLEPAKSRPVIFYRGNDVFNQKGLGFVSNLPNQESKEFFEFDTRLPGNGNYGHEGEAYGTTLSAENKDALVEFLKTF